MGHLDKCRVCFTAVASDDEAYNLLGLPKLAVKFSDCTGLVVDPADAHIISSEICCQCYEQLQQFHTFRALCLTADRKWRLKRRVCQRGITRERTVCLMEEKEQEKQDPGQQGQEDLDEEEEQERQEMQEELEEQERKEQDMQEEQKESEEDDDDQDQSSLQAPDEDMQEEQEESEQDDDDQEQASLQAPELVLCDGNRSPKKSPPKHPKNAQRRTSPRKPAKKGNVKIPAVISAPDLFYTCDICSERFEEYRSLIKHKEEHDGHSLYHCTEPGCEESFDRYEQCRQHELQHAEEGTRFICGQAGCNKLYRHKASLKQHQSKAHAIGEPPKTHMCEFCGRVFQNLSALTHHRYTHSDQMKLPFACEMPDCTLRFISKEKLKIHMMRHQGIKNYSCPYCGLRKTTKNELRLHINFHTLERNWSCKLCSKVCNSSTSLKKHISTIHEKTRDYACSYCEKSFANSNTRKYHEMTHTGEKNFECHECGKKFTQPAALRTHRLVHERQAEREEDSSTFGGETMMPSIANVVVPPPAVLQVPPLVVDVTHPVVVDVPRPVIVAQLQPAFTILHVTSLDYPTL